MHVLGPSAHSCVLVPKAPAPFCPSQGWITSHKGFWGMAEIPRPGEAMDKVETGADKAVQSPWGPQERSQVLRMWPQYRLSCVPTVPVCYRAHPAPAVPILKEEKAFMRSQRGAGATRNPQSPPVNPGISQLRATLTCTPMSFPFQSDALAPTRQGDKVGEVTATWGCPEADPTCSCGVLPSLCLHCRDLSQKHLFLGSLLPGDHLQFS